MKYNYTQQEIADIVHVSDKAVSKWERDLCMPDISILSKLSIYFDTDVDYLLSNNDVHIGKKWKGILNISNVEIDIFKNIDRNPIMSCLLSYFILSGIDEVLIICNKNQYKKLHERINNYCIKVYLVVSIKQIELQKKFFENLSNVFLIFNCNFLYGVGLTKSFQKPMLTNEEFTVLAIPSDQITADKIIYFDSNKNIVLRKKINIKNTYIKIPFYYFRYKKNFDLKILFSNEIIFYYDFFINCNPKVELLDRGYIYGDFSNNKKLYDINKFLKYLKKYTNKKIFDIKEVLYNRGYV